MRTFALKLFVAAVIAVLPACSSMVGNGHDVAFAPPFPPPRPPHDPDEDKPKDPPPPPPKPEPKPE